MLEPVLPHVVPIPMSLLQKQRLGEQRAGGCHGPAPGTASLRAPCRLPLPSLLARPFQGASRYDPFSGTGNKGHRNGNLSCPSGKWELNIWNILMLNTVLLGLISAEGKHVHIYFKPIKQTRVIVMDASLGRAGDTCRGLSTGSQLGAGCPVATVTSSNTYPDKTGRALGSGSGSRGSCLPARARGADRDPHPPGAVRQGCAAPRSIPNPTGQPTGAPEPFAGVPPLSRRLSPTPKHVVRPCLLSGLAGWPLLLRLPYFYKVDFRVAFRTITNS